VKKLFLESKLSSWSGVLIVILIAVAMGWLLAENMILGIGVFGFIVGLAVIIACLLSTETGFYVVMVCCFSVYAVSRFFADGLPVGVITDVLTVAMLFSFFIKGVSLKASINQFTHSPIVILMILNFLYGSLEIFNPDGHSFEAWLQAIRRSFETFVFLFVVFQLLRDKGTIRRFIRVLFILCTLAAVYGCIQQWHGLFDYERTWAMADPIRFGLLFINGDFRKFSTFNDPTAFGTTMAACSVFFTVLALNQRDKRIKWTLLAGVLLMLLAMAYSGTRTANVMLIAGFGMFALLTINKRATRTFAVIASLVFAGILYAPVYSNNTINRFRSSFVGSQDESYNVRVLSRNLIRPYMLSHPFGGGLGTTGNLGMALNPGHFLAGFQTDSGYLQLALEIGWIGLIIICTLFFFVLKGGARAYFHSSDEEMKSVYAAGTCAIFCYYVGMFAQNTLGNITDMAFYYPVLAIILRFKYFE
jgi:O-antigen ligase/polysaccharide polymerase Wzy-like membrane protein